MQDSIRGPGAALAVAWREVAPAAGGLALGAVAMVVLGVVLIGLRLPAGSVVLVLGLAILLATSRSLGLLALVFAVPASTIGWDVELATIGGRSFDTRLLITFAVAALVALRVVIDRERLPAAAVLIGLLAAYAAVIGALRADSVLTWAPQVARWTAYAGVLALASLSVRRGLPLRWVVVAAVVGCAVPATLGVLRFVIGDASFINGAVRATSPGGRGPIGLAFAGEMAFILGLGLLYARASARAGATSGSAIGFLAVATSATRLVTVTAWVASMLMTLADRRWRAALLVTLLFAGSLVLRPDLIGRFVSAIPGASEIPIGTPDPNGGSSPGSDGVEVDRSLRFRFFVWNTVLAQWREEPILGIGTGMTAPVVADASPRAVRAAPHNDYIGILAELGIVGIVLYGAIQLIVIAHLFIRWRSAPDPGLKHLLGACLVLFVAIDVAAAINNPIYFFDIQVALWALVGAAMASPGLRETAIPDRR